MKTRPFTLFLVLFFCLGMSSAAQALTIGGAVRQPLSLDVENLKQMGAAHVLRVTELSRAGTYGGVFDYSGVSLKTLLQMAAVQKETAGYSRSINLAILVRNREGKAITLSWGEIFHRNPSHIIIAVSAGPVVPSGAHKCGECHDQSFFKPVLANLDRKIGFPKLVVGDDLYTDRNLEDIVSIEVVDLNKEVNHSEDQRPSPAKFTVLDGTGVTKTVSDLSGLSQVRVTLKQVGSGRGFHGLKRFQGAPVGELLKKLNVMEDADSILLFTSTDGYQSLLSYGEIVLSALGKEIIIAETKDPPEGFVLVAPNDILSDRMVKSIHKVEVISLRPKAKLYMIGVGCGDTSLITLEALSRMGKADAFIAPEDLAARFKKHMGDKSVLFDPFSSFEPEFKKRNPGLKGEELKRGLEAQRMAQMKDLRGVLASGKSVAVLDYGDPTMYGGWQHWLEPEFADRLEVVPGISAMSAANAMMGYNLACDQDSMIVTTPGAMRANEAMLKAVAAKGDLIVIYMGLKDMNTVVSLLKRYFAGKTPVIVAYKAGYSREGRLLKTNLDRILADTEKETEKHLGIIYVGPGLR